MDNLLIILFALSFLLIPIFALRPLWGLMLLLIIRPELGLLRDVGLVKYTGALPLVYFPFVVLAGFRFDLCWQRLKYLYIFILVCLLTLAYSIDLRESIHHVLKPMSYIAIFLLAYNLITSKKDAFKLLYCFPIAAIYPMVIGYYQFLSGQVVQKGQVMESFTSLFRLPNPFSRFLFLVCFASLPLIYTYKKDVLKKFLMYAFLCAILVCIVLLRVRGPMVTIVVAGLMFLYLSSKNKIYGVLIGLFLCSLWIPLVMDAFTRIFNPLPDKVYGGESLYWRFEMWRQLLPAFKNKAFIGFGAGTSDHISMIYTKFGGNIPHNDYLRVLLENGLVGFVSYMAFYVSNLRASFRDKKFIPENSHFNICTIVLIVSYLILSSAANVFYSVDFMWYLFCFWAITHKLNTIVTQERAAQTLSQT